MNWPAGFQAALSRAGRDTAYVTSCGPLKPRDCRELAPTGNPVRSFQLGSGRFPAPGWEETQGQLAKEKGGGGRCSSLSG